jgi:hypothetical protein
LKGTSTHLREVVEHLAALERGACSAGEREAAEWISERFRDLGCEGEIEEELAFDRYAAALGALGALAAGAGVASLRSGARLLPAAIAAGAAAAVADDASNGKRWYRRAVMKRKPTTNVVARIGDADAPRTLVVLAHHDAHPTSFIFDQRLERWIAQRQQSAPEGGFPFWYPILAAPLLIALGAATGRRGLTKAGIAGQTLGVAAALDLARHRIVPGANDNLSAVAGLVGLARALRDDPVPGVRVLLVSCGAEETLQGGIYGFIERHRSELDPATTSFLNFELLGARDHLLLEGEGPLVLEDYEGPALRDLVARAADRAGIEMRRGVRLHVSTDAVVPSRAGYPTATLITVDELGMIPNYHLMSDTPENVEYSGIEGAIEIAAEVVRELGRLRPANVPESLDFE